MAGLNTLREPFNGGVSANFAVFGTGVGGSAIAYTNNRANMTLPSSVAGSNYVTVASTSTGDLTGVSVLCELVSAPPANANVNTYLAVYQSAGEQTGWDVVNGSLVAFKVIAGVVTGIFSTTYNSTNHRWLLIRESGGTVFFDTSTDGATWTNRASTAKPAHVTNAAIVAQSGTEASVASPGTAVFDNINLPNVFLAAAGASSSAGTADAAVTHTLAAAGAASSTGTAAAVVTHTLAAAGASSSAGTADVVVTHTLAASGDSVAAGTAALVVTHTLAAGGDSVSAGTAALTLSPVLAASGAATSSGVAALTVSSRIAIAVAHGLIAPRWQAEGSLDQRWRVVGSAGRRWLVEGGVN